MSGREETIPESFKTKFEISPQLDLLIKQMGIQNMRDVIEPSISNEELDELLNKITLEGNKNRYLMEIVNVIATSQKITDRDELINLKIKVLLDNLSKKMCKCYYKTNKKIGICRSSIFQKRNLDFITFDCGETEKNELHYNYGLGPLLKPSVSGNPIILRRPLSSSDTSKLKSPQKVESTPIKIVSEKQSSPTVDYSIPDKKQDEITSHVILANLEATPMNPLDIDCSTLNKFTCRKPCKWNGFRCYR
jgi:hypothetical protein